MKTELVHLGARIIDAPENVALLKSNWNYTTIYFKNGRKAMVATTIGHIEKRLPNHLFFRVNRSTIVNLKCVQISSDFSHVKSSILGKLKVSRRRKMDFMATMV